jgi:ribosomal protein S18 acetylase RimI-like enzyme
MEIIRANLAMLDPLAELFDQYRQFYEEEPDLDACRAFMGKRIVHNQSVIFAARAGSGELVGFTQLYRSYCSVALGDLIYLYDLFVAPAARRQGVASALMEAARQYGLEQDACRLQLETAVSNLSGQALYEKLGWQRDEEFYTYHLELGKA